MSVQDQIQIDRLLSTLSMVPAAPQLVAVRYHSEEAASPTYHYSYAALDKQVCSSQLSEQYIHSGIFWYFVQLCIQSSANLCRLYVTRVIL